MSGVQEPRQRLREFSLFSSFSFSLPTSFSRAAGARGTASLLGISSRGPAGSRGAGTRETPPPPAGKIAPQLFCFQKPFRVAKPVFGRRSAGPGSAGDPGLGDSSGLGDARGNCKFVTRQASASHSCPKLPHSARGWSRVPGWAVSIAP